MNATEPAARFEARTDVAAALEALEQMFGYYDPSAAALGALDEEDDYALAA